ncbi:hypothetical protein IYY11_21320 [Methylocystis sp. H62]|uniref:hypothetical protein n=1 Tax=Methylocystis sp. H62 TaxID=2785789 RepID=UPI0018C2EE74|nr:hypothetical protein [Methylocystis sp. H62]MBG0795902.1 hypothetical protein [Methylocystis sp. H62]
MPLQPNALPFAPPTLAAPFDAALAFGTNAVAETKTSTGYFGAPTQLDIGQGHVRGEWVINITALDQVTGDESCTFHLLGSNDVAWANGNVEILQSQNFGGASGRAFATIPGATPAPGASAYGPAGTRSQFPFSNMKSGIVYRYLRCYAVIGGTTPSITANTFLSLGM